MGRKTKVGGLVALGIAAAAAAYWKWGVSADDKEKIKSSVKDKAKSLKQNASDLAEKIPQEVKQSYNNAKAKVEETVAAVSKKLDYKKS